jgi:hypothetical protein
MAKKVINPMIRFNQKYIVNVETGCWEWQDRLNIDGYGLLKINGKSIRAHRYAYEYFVGPLDINLEICHNCNNRKCVNPKHLRQDTQKSNMIDKSYLRTNPSQVLSVEEVIEIKKALKYYYRGQVNDLAHFYKVNPYVISFIKTGKTWSHVVI